MKRKAVLMIMLSAVLTLGTGLPAYAAAEGAVTESAYEEADSEESLTAGAGLPRSPVHPAAKRTDMLTVTRRT